MEKDKKRRVPLGKVQFTGYRRYAVVAAYGKQDSTIMFLQRGKPSHDSWRG